MSDLAYLGLGAAFGPLDRRRRGLAPQSGDKNRWARAFGIELDEPSRLKERGTPQSASERDWRPVAIASLVIAAVVIAAGVWISSMPSIVAGALLGIAGALLVAQPTAGD